MKKYYYSVFIVLCIVSVFAQSKNNKVGLYAGGGFQHYKGDLGNGFTQIKDATWYGLVSVNIGFYINKSFDFGVFGSKGDFGFCQPTEKINQEVAMDDRCPGCIGRVGLGNLSSRMTSGGVLVKYKLANNYLLSENSKVKPYFFVGVAINNLADRMKMQCVVPGNYCTINSGAGIKYNITNRISLNYNLTLGYFTSDRLDFLFGRKNDMHMQNTLLLGIDIF